MIIIDITSLILSERYALMTSLILFSLHLETEELRGQLEKQKAQVMKLQAEVSELARKETAYKKTIQEGDELLQARTCPGCLPPPSTSEARLDQLERENSDLLDQVERLREVERRFKDLQQNEKFLRGRVDELEQTESSLRTSISSIDRKMSDREIQFQRKIDDLEDELQVINMDCTKSKMT